MITSIPPSINLARGTLYLTQILVSYEDAVRILKIRDTYDWHQRVWQAFAGRERKSRDFLIRVDRKEEAYRVLILSQSLPQKPGWCPTDCFGTRTIPHDYFQHVSYRFSLLANPTKKLRVDNPDGTRKKNGRRVPITKREELMIWIERKAQIGGFSIDQSTLKTIPRGREFFHKPCAHGAHMAVEFQGQLTVTDLTLFRASVASGIGSAKAFGFGMIVLVPVS
jgi:CRISPR system Cascade subunit CasE